VDVGAVGNSRAAAFRVAQRDDGLAADEPGATAAFHRQLVRLGWLLLGDLDLALEGALHAAHPDFHRGLVLVGTDRLQLFAAGNGFLQPRGIEERLPDLLTGRGNVVRDFELHAASLLRTMCRTRARIVPRPWPFQPAPGGRNAPTRE